MNALLLVAHGSRQDVSNQQVRHLVEEIRGRAGDRFECVALAFLQFTEPTVSEAVEECARSGVAKIVVLPYLLSPGAHVNHDIPELIEQEQRRHPAIDFETVPYVGASPRMPELLLELAGAD